MKNRTIKISIILLFIFVTLSILTNMYLYRNYTKKINENVLRMVSVIKEKYPDVSDEELATILNDKGKNKNFLDTYGVDNEDIFMLENTRGSYSLFQWVNAIILSIFGIISIFLLYLYIRNRKKKVKEIGEYIRQINKQIYELKLDENVEDELSILQNELYKITVLLKEQSENATSDKLGLKDNLSDISHQLKTPLTSISIMIDNMIDDENMDSETRKEFLNDIRKQIENINFLVISILKLSRFDADVIKFSREDINVKALLTEAIKNLENLIKEKDTNINITGEKDVVFIGDYRWEVEAITNILKNCVESLSKNGSIEISFRKLSIYTEIDIKDNGKGIDKNDLKNIFERFYKGKNSAEDSIGIGLSLSKKIIEMDGGYINVKSEVGVGTRFTVRYMSTKGIITN